MKISTFRKVQFLANVAILVLGILLSGVIIKQYFLPSANRSQPINPVTQQSQTINQNNPSLNLVGKTLPIENVEWNKHKINVVLYISNSCHFCTESSLFYQKLVKESASNDDLNLIAILPQSVEEGEEYLKKLSVNIKNVFQISPNVTGLRGTPTILLVNEKGIITNAWMGKLSPEREKQVIDKLGA